MTGLRPSRTDAVSAVPGPESVERAPARPIAAIPGPPTPADPPAAGATGVPSATGVPGASTVPARPWDIAFPAAAVVLAVILAALAPERLAVGAGVLAVLVAGWFLIGRRACGVHTGTAGSRPAAVGFAAIVVLCSGALTAIEPTLAIVQFLAFPAVWVFATSTRAAIIANVGVALAVGLGFVAANGVSPGSVAGAAATEAISFAISMVMGFWITRVEHRSAERQALLDELHEAQDQLAALSRERGATAERERLAREIHDTLAQSLTGIVLLVQRARRDQADTTADRAATLDLLEEAARDALVEARSVVAATAAVDLDAGLAAALGRLAARFERETGVRVEVAVDPVELARDEQVVLLRTAQEALANVRKHAGATLVELRLGGAEGGAALVVRDDGRGFDAGDPPAGFGLPGLRDRLALVGGTLAVSSRPGATELVAALPATPAPAAPSAAGMTEPRR